MITRFQVTRVTVRRVLNQHKDLSRKGFNYVNPGNQSAPVSAEQWQEWRDYLEKEVGLDEITTACEYILSHDIPDWWGSYTLKHVAERWGRENGYSVYVSNGAVIVAAILCGFSILREENSPNCTFPEKDNDLFHRERKMVG